MLEGLVSKLPEQFLERSSGIVWTQEMFLQNFAAVLLYHYDENKPVFKVFSYGEVFDPSIMQKLR